MDHSAKVIEFVSYCLEMYAVEYGISGQDVAGKFEKYGVVDYLFNNYEALHTQGWGYILPLIDELIMTQESK